MTGGENLSVDTPVCKYSSENLVKLCPHQLIFGALVLTENRIDLRHTVVISHADGGFNRRHGTGQIERAAQEAQIPHHEVHTLEQLDEALSQCPESTSLLVINAGDGTVCRVVQQLRTRPLFTSEPHLALLQGGTTNMIHRDVGWHGEPMTALQQLLSGIREHNVLVQQRQPLKISQLGQPERYGFFFETNAIVRGILQAREQLHRRGLTGRTSEILSALRMLGNLLLKKLENDPVMAPAVVKVSVDKQAGEEREQIFLIAFSLRKLILGIRPLRKEQISGISILNWPNYSITQWLRNLMRAKLDEFNSLSLNGNFSWILDGEIYHHALENTPLSIQLDDPVNFVVRER